MAFYFDDSFQKPPPNPYNLGNISQQLAQSTYHDFLPKPFNLGNVAATLQMPDGSNSGAGEKGNLAQYLLSGVTKGISAALMGDDEDGGRRGPSYKYKNYPTKGFKLSKWLASFYESK